MAHIAAIVESLEASGLQGSKRSAKGSGHGGKLADFLATFTARLGVEQGKADEAAQAAQTAPVAERAAESQPKAAPDKEDPVASLLQTSADDGKPGPALPGLPVDGGAHLATAATQPGTAEGEESTAPVGARRLAQLLARNGEPGGGTGKAELPEATAKPAELAAGDGQNLPAEALEIPLEHEDSGVALALRSFEPASTANLASQPVQTAGQEGTAIRPAFDTLPRQVETRLNVAVEAPVKSPAFPGEFAEKVVWLSSRQGHVAELSLNPPQLGTVEVRLTVSPAGEAGAQFFSPNPVVREAIEAALPRLRELMAQAGIQLGESQVRDQALAQGGEGSSRGRNGGEGQGEAPAEVAGVLAATRRNGLGLVDLYA